MESNSKGYKKLDYSLSTPEERVKFVEQVIAETDESKLTPRYLTILADYIIFAIDKQERQKKEILTPERMVTVNMRETSYQGLVSRFENGEDGVHNLITNDKNIIFKHKVAITEEDLAEIPALKELCQEIEKVEAAEKQATGKKRFLLRKQLIEMRKDQYVIKNEFKKPMYSYSINTNTQGLTTAIKDDIYLDENNEPVNNSAFSFFDPKKVSNILCNYNELKVDAERAPFSDLNLTMEDFDKLYAAALSPHPMLKRISDMKIEGYTNLQIKKKLKEETDTVPTVEYISSLWRNKIPKVIAEYAKQEYLEYHYLDVERGKWKKCSRCGQIKLAHNRYFSRNCTSKDGFYSICKTCRNKKPIQKKG